MTFFGLESYKLITKELENTLKQIKLVIFDVDGVLTDGSLYLGEDGNEYKAFNARDGLGIVLLKKTGCHVGVISGRSSKVVSDRMQAIGVEYVYMGQSDKFFALSELINKLEIKLEEVAYLGDDLIDLPAMCHVGFPVAVADADEAVKDNAIYITEKNGGRGAAREVCDLIMQAQGNYQSLLDDFTRPRKSD